MQTRSPRRTLRTAVWAVGLVLSGWAPGQALAADEQRLYLKSLAATCANCHGTDGRSAPGATVSGLAGLDKAYLVQQMTAFKTGARPATVMHQIARGYSDAQIAALAVYFAEQAR